MDPEIWGPSFWFFLHTLAYNYPDFANQVTRRKYYDFIQNLPLFIPDAEMGNRFAQMLDKYPVVPYLDNRDSFMLWMHFIHNKYNYILGKEEISLQESIQRFLEKFRKKNIQITVDINLRRHIVYAILILCFLFFIFAAYREK